MNINDIKSIENVLNYVFPEDYKNYIIHNNNLADTILLFNGNEKVIRKLFSMTKEDKYYYILNHQKFDSKLVNKIIPIALLEFGDTICFEKDTNNIVLYDRETDSISFVSNNWTNFIEMLVTK